MFKIKQYIINKLELNIDITNSKLNNNYPGDNHTVITIQPTKIHRITWYIGEKKYN
jgi:hypothetical protein